MSDNEKKINKKLFSSRKLGLRNIERERAHRLAPQPITRYERRDLMDALEMAASTASARAQMAFQERMSNTAHQREVADLKAAGLNPILSAHTQGASTPTGAAGDYSGVEPQKLLDSTIKTSAKAMNLAEDTIKQLQDSVRAGTATTQQLVDAVFNNKFSRDDMMFSNAAPEALVRFLEKANIRIGNFRIGGKSLLAALDAFSNMGYDLREKGIYTDSADRLAGLIGVKLENSRKPIVNRLVDWIRSKSSAKSVAAAAAHHGKF